MTWMPPEKPSFEEHMAHVPYVKDTPWERIEYGARLTGRTYRMVQKALELHKQGYAVYILVHSFDYGQDLRRIYQLPENINIETPRTLHPDRIDWQHMQPSFGAWPNTKLLVDHLYIEQRFRDIMREYHAYDYIPE